METNIVKTSRLTPDTLESEYGIKKSHQAKLRMRKQIPYSRIGTKIIIYSRQGIEDWIDNAKVV